jgi:lysozyme family protein
MPPEDGEAGSRTLVTPPHVANEDRHLVDARRDKLLASGRTHTEFGQLIAKMGRSNAYRHANNRTVAARPKQGNVCTPACTSEEQRGGVFVKKCRNPGGT